MTITRGIAKKVFVLTHDFDSEKAFAEYTDEYSGGALDSVDGGDSFGYWIAKLEGDEFAGDGDDEFFHLTPGGNTITISYDWELFRWNSKEIPQTIGQMIADIGPDEVIRRIREEFGE